MVNSGKLFTFLPLFALIGCPPAYDDKDTPEDTDTSAPLDTEDTDTEDTTDTDTGRVETGDTGGSDTGGDSAEDTAEDTADTGDSGSEFAIVIDDADLLDVTDVAAAGDAGTYVIGFNLAGEAGVWWIATESTDAVQVFVGDPLIQPTGIAVSDDGSTLYVSDLGVASPSGNLNGAVYAMPSGGGALSEQGTADVIDLPGDVAWAPDGSGLYVSGFASDGSPAIFRVSSGSATIAVSGGQLADPTAIAFSPDGAWMFVVDSLAAEGRAAILRYAVPGFAEEEIAANFQVAFPGGVASDEISVFYTQIGRPGLYEMAYDGADVATVGTLESMVLPTGLSTASGGVYVTESAADAGADLYFLSF